ncbi:hypothetical protein ACOMHN_001798 [Nucella lapillus]
MVETLYYWSSHEPHRPAFIFVDKHRNRFELSRQQLYDLGGRWAAVVQEGGVGRRERVVSTLVNCPERALCDAGIVLAGAVVVNGQCQLADGSDLLLVLRQSKACAVCLNPDLDFGPWTVLKQHVQHDPITNTVTSQSLPDLRKVFFVRRTAPLCEMSSDVTEKIGLEDGFGSPETKDFIATLQTLDTFYKADVAADETVIVFTTSGSTGFSKLVPHTHADWMTCLWFLKQSPIDKFFLVFNSSNLGWLGGYLFTYLALGQGRVIFDVWDGVSHDLATLVWDSIVQESCYSGVIMPYLLPKILALDNRKTWRMKNVILAGQPLRKSMLHQALQLSEAVLVTYASTELLMITAMVLKDASEYQDFLVGRILPNNTIRICNSDGKEVPRGTKGEIYGKTLFMVKSYLNNEEDMSASFTGDGFLKTGDMGVMLDDGSLLVEGRKSDAIHRGNFIFYPAWLESRIMHCCPGLQEVFIVGVPDSTLGEEICACFVPSDPCLSDEGVRSLVEADILPTLEDPLSPRPRYYLRFQAFPRTYTDKPLRKDVRRLAIERLHLA